MSENFSQKLIDISGSLLEEANSHQELQSRLDIVITAWNLSLLSKADRQLKLKRLIRKQKGIAPSKEAWKALEEEIKEIVRHKLNLYPEIEIELLRAEAILNSKNNYDIKVYFKDAEEEAKLKEAQLSVTNFNKLMSK